MGKNMVKKIGTTYRTSHSIRLSHIPPKTQEEFWQRLFYYRNGALATKASKMYEIVKSGRINTMNRADVIKELGLNNDTMYYHVLRSLISIGLVRKEFGLYKTSREFIERLRRLIEFAE